MLMTTAARVQSLRAQYLPELQRLRSEHARVDETLAELSLVRAQLSMQGRSPTETRALIVRASELTTRARAQVVHVSDLVARADGIVAVIGAA